MPQQRTSPETNTTESSSPGSSPLRSSPLRSSPPESLFDGGTLPGGGWRLAKEKYPQEDKDLLMVMFTSVDIARRKKLEQSQRDARPGDTRKENEGSDGLQEQQGRTMTKLKSKRKAETPADEAESGSDDEKQKALRSRASAIETLRQAAERALAFRERVGHTVTGKAEQAERANEQPGN